MLIGSQERLIRLVSNGIVLLLIVASMLACVVSGTLVPALAVVGVFALTAFSWGGLFLVNFGVVWLFRFWIRTQPYEG